MVSAWVMTSGAVASDGERGVDLARAFDEREYGAHQQNWAVVQSPDGVIHVANTKGLLSYDGERWRLTSLFGRPAFSLAVGVDGTIFVGANGMFGRVVAGGDGEPRFESFVERLPAGADDVGVIRVTVATASGVYFVGFHHLYRWTSNSAEGGDLEVIPAPADAQHPAVFCHLTEVRGRILVGVLGRGLMVLENDALRRLEGTETFAASEREINFVLSDGEKGLLIGTTFGGVFRFDEQGVRPIEGALATRLPGTLTVNGIRLRDGRVAISNQATGLVLVEPDGTIDRVVSDFGHELPIATIHGAVCQDSAGGVWLPLDFGLVRVDVGSSIQTFDRHLGLHGTPHAIARHAGRLHVGTGRGLFRLMPSDAADAPARFETVGDADVECHDLATVGGRFFAATSGGLFEVGDDGLAASPRLDRATVEALAAVDGRTLYVGVYDGIRAIATDDERAPPRVVWQAPRPGVPNDLIGDPAQPWLWFAWSDLGVRTAVVRVALDDAGDEPRERYYGPEQGLPPASSFEPFAWRGRVFVGTPDGLYRYEPVGDEFVLDDGLGAELARLGGGILNVAVDEARGPLWFWTGEGRTARAEDDGSGRWRISYPLADARLSNVLVTYVDPDGVLWAGSGDGRLLRRAPVPSSAADDGLAAVLIRRVSTSERTLAAGAARPTVEPSLSYEDDSIRFEYALPSFGAADSTMYRSRLVGYDGTWTPWRRETHRDFTDLWEGRYRFEVQARDVRGREGAVTAFAFDVRPPPYRTGWAYFLYGVLAVSFLHALIRLRLRRANRQLGALRHEIAERRRAEHLLQESETRLRALVETTTDWVWEVDRELRVTYSSPRSTELLGREPNEVVGTRLTDLVPAHEAARVRMLFADLLESREAFADVGIVFAGPAGVEVEVESSGVSIRDRDGGVTGFRGIGRDVTRRNQGHREKQRLEDQLRQAQKLEAIGRLAGGISHDFNNILTALLGSAAIAEMILAEEEPDRATISRCIEEIRTAGERAAALTAQLLAFSRKQVLQPRLLDVNDVIRRMEALLKRVIPSHIEVKAHLAPDAGKILADVGQVEQVVLNLCINARDAMEDGGRLSIETSRVHVEIDDLWQHPTAKSGWYVVISVSDTGHGIDPDDLPLIFEPFFTTKPLGKGTGLGLASTHGIVTQSGGHVTVRSEPGHGATFRVHFPVVDASAAAPIGAVATTGEREGTATILLCEDDDAVLRSTRRALRMYGFDVIAAASPDEALELATTAEVAIDVLITDLVMPGMSGAQLADEIRAIGSCSNVLLISGYAPDEGLGRRIAGEHVEWLQKPFTPEQLVRRVREILARRGEEPETKR